MSRTNIHLAHLFHHGKSIQPGGHIFVRNGTKIEGRRILFLSIVTDQGKLRLVDPEIPEDKRKLIVECTSVSTIIRKAMSLIDSSVKTNIDAWKRCDYVSPENSTNLVEHLTSEYKIPSQLTSIALSRLRSEYLSAHAEIPHVSKLRQKTPSSSSDTGIKRQRRPVSDMERTAAVVTQQTEENSSRRIQSAERAARFFEAAYNDLLARSSEQTLPPMPTYDFDAPEEIIFRADLGTRGRAISHLSPHIDETGVISCIFSWYASMIRVPEEERNSNEFLNGMRSACNSIAAVGDVVNKYRPFLPFHQQHPRVPSLQLDEKKKIVVFQSAVDSTIVGLVATCDFKRGDWISILRGEIVSDLIFEGYQFLMRAVSRDSMYTCRYTKRLVGGRYVLGGAHVHIQNNVCAMAEYSSAYANVYFDYESYSTRMKGIPFVAKRDITAGEYLFVDDESHLRGRKKEPVVDGLSALRN